MKSFFNGMLALLLLGAHVAAHARQPVVVELFTSQGCSSCPPADAYLTELAQTRPDVLPLAFHVTYWNYLGWKDPFSLSEADERQAAYAEQSGGRAYTPQIVVDGADSFVGSSRTSAAAAIAAAERVTIQAPELSVSAVGQMLSVHVAAGAGGGRLVLIGFDRRHETRVVRGENAGSVLTESNIVRSCVAIGLWNGASLALNVRAPLGDDAAILLQDSRGHILSAARLKTDS